MFNDKYVNPKDGCLITDPKENMNYFGGLIAQKNIRKKDEHLNEYVFHI